METIDVFVTYVRYAGKRIIKESPLYIQAGLHYRQLEAVIEAIKLKEKFIELPAGRRNEFI